MQKDKAQKAFAKKLVQLSLDDKGQVSGEKVSAVLEALKQKPPRKLPTLLKQYQVQLRRALRNSQIRVEYAGALSDATLGSLQKSYSKHYNRELTISTEENKKLLAGIRVIIGDDVYDSTVAGRLSALRSAAA